MQSKPKRGILLVSSTHVTKSFFAFMAGPFSSRYKTQIAPWKISQDQITAVKPPLVPGPAFSSSSLLVADPFQYHLGEAAGAASPRQEQKWKALYPTEIPGLTHIYWLA